MALLTSLNNLLSGTRNTERFNIFEVVETESERMRVKHFQRLFDYYVGDEDQIKRSLRAVMSRTFDAETLAELQYPYFNIVKRIVDRLALAYKEAADRYIVGNPSADEAYQKILGRTNINAQAKRWQRLARLLDTVYVGVVWRKDHVEYDILPPHLVTVLEQPDNYLEAKELVFRKVMRLPEGTEQNVFVRWTDDEHEITDLDGVRVSGEGLPNGKNPYGVLPYIPLRLRETENHWGEGDAQLVDICEQINVLLVSTMDNAIMQAHGQPVAINFNLNQEGEERKLLTGPKHIIQVDNASKDEIPPSFSFEHPQPAIDECRQMIDWLIRRAAIDRGIPAEAVGLDIQAQSGSAKAIDNWGLMEAREDDIEALRPFEKRLFDVTVAVYNYHSQDSLPVDLSFGIDFAELKPPVNELTDLQAKQLKWDLNIWTPIDDFIDEDEGIDRKEAIRLAKEKISDKKMLLDLITPTDANQNLNNRQSNPNTTGPTNPTL